MITRNRTTTNQYPLMRSLFLCLMLFLGAAHQSMAGDTIFIKGGSITGLYYGAATTLCDIVNTTADAELHCAARGGPGSAFNIRALQRGVLDFGIVQSDRQWEAWVGRAEWSGNKATGIRSVFSLHTEAVMLIARRDAAIDSIEDLRGKRVNIGNPGSGQRGNAIDVLRISGIDPDDDIDASGMQQGNASLALIDNKIDAFFYTVGNPSEAISMAADATDIRLINIDSPDIQSFVSAYPPFIMTMVPRGTYRGMEQDVITFGVKATVVTRHDMPDETVYRFTKAVFSHLEQLKSSHPALQELTPAKMLEGLSAPLHPGAKRFYREMGWSG